MLSLVIIAALLGQSPTSQPVTGGEGYEPARPSPVPGLAEPYIDGTYGYSIQPPPGWQIIPTSVPDRSDLVLLRLVQSQPGGGFREISIRQTTLPERKVMSELVKQLAGELELRFSNLRIFSQQVQPMAGRPAGCITAGYWRENREHLRIEALIDAGRGQFMRLIWTGPLDQRAESEALFARVAASFQLLRDHVTEDQLRQALEAGTTWLASLRGEAIRAAIVPEEFLRIDRDGTIIGFISIVQSAGQWEQREGLRIRERGWTFEPDGQLTRVQHSMFLSDDLKHERWKSSVTTYVPQRGEQPKTLLVALEEGLRADRYLLSNQCYDIFAPATENPPLTLPPTYLPRALVRLLPRLVGDVSKANRLGFTYFDHRRADLVLRVLEPRGEATRPPPELADRAATGRVFQIDEREGLASNPAELFVDEKGRTLLARVGKTTLTPTTAKAMEAQFGHAEALRPKAVSR
jgi:hypothetical protein